MVLRASLRRCFFYALKESDWMDTLKGKQIMVPIMIECGNAAAAGEGKNVATAISTMSNFKFCSDR